jgi:hypothetical protein
VPELYRVYDSEGRLLYVGSAAYTLARLVGHRSKAWFRAAAKVEIEHFETAEQALSAEATAILTESPLYNINQVITIPARRGGPKGPRSQSLRVTKPWEALGMSRATWYRRQEVPPPITIRHSTAHLIPAH